MEAKMSEEQQTEIAVIDGAMIDGKTEAEISAILDKVLEETEAEDREFAERLKKLSGWRWIKGMSTTDRELVVGTSEDGILQVLNAKRFIEVRNADEAIPDLSDPLTVLSIIDLVRSALPDRDFVVAFTSITPYRELARAMVMYLENPPPIDKSVSIVEQGASMAGASAPDEKKD
jgi:hypothetical protein